MHWRQRRRAGQSATDAILILDHSSNGHRARYVAPWANRAVYRLYANEAAHSSHVQHILTSRYLVDRVHSSVPGPPSARPASDPALNSIRP